MVANTAIGRGNHKRLPVNHEPDMADETFIKNLIDRFAIINTPVRFSDHTGALGR
jgi:hypothetical protein